MKRALFLLFTLIASATLAQNLGPGVTRGDLFKSRQYQTYATNLNLYVDSTGNDGNACTSTGTDACLTIQGALNKIPKNVRSAVLLTVGSGNFTGAFIDGFNLINDLGANATGTYIDITGTLANFVPATGTATGTATGGTNGTGASAFGTLVDAGQTWTANDLRGRLIRITGGTGSGQTFVIQSNTGTTITIVGLWIAPNATSTYVISDWATTINAGVPIVPTSSTGSLTATQSGFRMGGEAGGETAITIRNFKFTLAGAMFSYGDAALQMINNRFETTGTTISIRGAPRLLNISTNSFSIANNQSVYSVATPGLQMGSMFNLYRGASGTGSAAILLVTGAGGSFQYDAVENLANGILIANGLVLNTRFDTITGVCNDFTPGFGGFPTTANTYISRTWGVVGGNHYVSCGTAVRAGGGQAVTSSGALTGSGNTLLYDIYQGGVFAEHASSTVTGATEISIDGTTYTLAALRALSPKQIVDMGTLSRIVER